MPYSWLQSSALWQSLESRALSVDVEPSGGQMVATSPLLTGKLHYCGPPKSLESRLYSVHWGWGTSGGQMVATMKILNVITMLNVGRTADIFYIIVYPIRFFSE